MNYQEKYYKYKQKYLHLKKMYAGAKYCSIDEMMTISKEEFNKCDNNNLVIGSCGDPSFKNNINDSKDYSNIKKLFEEIKKYIIKINITDIVIIVGAIYQQELQFPNGKSSLNIFITPTSDFKTVEQTIEKLNKTDDNSIRNLYVNAEFPLAVNDKIKEILDIIIDIHFNHSKVFLINKLCGDCFRSFYYLRKNSGDGIGYDVSPLQSTDKRDTDEIKSCFKYPVNTEFKSKIIVINQE
jgi:hypothetical protein